MAIGSSSRIAGFVGNFLIGLTAVLAGVDLLADEKGYGPKYEVTTCIESGIAREAGLAQVIAKKMFADIGVWVDFHDETNCPADRNRDVIHIHLNTGVPAERFPGALAYALPYEGVHIQVFADRIRKSIDPKRVPNLLAHVLAHEITHILQGINRHSQYGIMKAKWNQEDHQRMGCKPLAFTEQDVRLIHLGLQVRASKGNEDGPVAANPAPEAAGLK